MNKTVPLFLLAGFLLTGCGQVPAEPAQTPAPEAPAAAPYYNWRDGLPAPSGELLPQPFFAALDPSEPMTEIEREHEVTLPDGTNLRLTFSGCVGVADTPVQQKRYRLQSVSVREGDSYLQIVTFTEPYFQSDAGEIWSEAEDFGVTVADMNFDGALDFSVKNILSSEKVTVLDEFAFHFLWDNEHRCFVPAPALDSLPNPLFDAASQTVASDYSGGRRDWSIESAYENLYRYVNGELQCVRRQETVLDKIQWLLTTRIAKWDGTIWVESPPETKPAYRERTKIAELQAGVWVKLTAWGLRSQPRPNAEDYQRGWLKQIDVFTDDPETTNAPPFQTIHCDPPIFPIYLETSDCFQAAFPDYNFDGCPDLRFFSGSGMGGFFYTCYLWSPRLGRFVENKTLSGYQEPTPNPITGEVDSFQKYGHIWGKTTLRWQGDDFVPVRESCYEYVFDPENPEDDTPPVRHTVSVCKDGEWTLVLEEILMDWDFEL